MTTSADFLPSRRVPLAWFALAHVSLATAFVLVALRPLSIVGFFYAPRVLAVVHLVTLGWITASILGALYLVLPLALRTPLPAGRWDVAALVTFALGLAAMAGHFWIDEPSGMAMGAVMVWVSVAGVMGRAALALRGAPVPAAVRAHVALASANLVAGGLLGVVIAFHKLWPFLPGDVLGPVMAHAHLMAVGFALTTVVGVGYRMMPMVLPAAMPAGRPLWATAILLQSGAAGLAIALAVRSAWASVFALLVVAAVLVFASQVFWMLRNLRPAPSARSRPDTGSAHVFASLVWLAVATAAGAWLVLAPANPATARVASVYGAAGLVGFLAQVVVGVQARLLPLASWLWGFAAGGYGPLPRPLHRLSSQVVQMVVFSLWVTGVPAVVVALGWSAPPLLAAGAWALALATLVGGGHALLVVRRARGGT